MRASASTTLIAAATAAATLAAGLAAPAPGAAAASVSAASAAVVPPGATTDLVTLLTGDRVVLRGDGAGHTTAALTPDSPHYGKPVSTYTYGGSTYVVPKLPLDERRRLDNSVFNVTALREYAGGAPLTVTFPGGTEPHDLPGVDVRGDSARSTRDGGTRAGASYDPARPLPAALTASLADVSRVAGPVPSVPQVAGDYVLHTLTIDATTASGAPTPYADVFVLNVDDGRLFGAFGSLIDGQWKLAVPEGHYSLVVSDFGRVVVHELTVGAADTEAAVSMAAATVRPSVRLADHRLLDGTLDIQRYSEVGGGLDTAYGGFLPRVSPTPPPARGLGSLTSSVAGTLVGRGVSYGASLHHVALTKDVRNGIPGDLSFTHRESDFAKVALKQYATGSTHQSLEGWSGFAPGDFFAFFGLFPVARPGVVHAWFQGSSSLTWLTVATSSMSFSAGQLDDLSAYRPGQTAAVDLFRSPVGPGLDRGGESANAGRACLLCVSRGRLHGRLPLFSPAGTSVNGELWSAADGAWSLAQGRDVLARGHGQIAPNVTSPVAGRPLTLSAVSHPQAPSWRLSTSVSDTWRFASPSRDSVIPILRARYAVPTGLDSVVEPGEVHFPLSFDNLGPADARVVEASLTWSLNGRRWHAADLRRVDANTFRVSYASPAPTFAHRTVHLRVHGMDAAGRGVWEEARDAYRLQPWPRHRASSSGVLVAPRRFHPRTLCRTSGTVRYSCFARLGRASLDGASPGADPAGWGATDLRDAYDLPDGGAGTTVAVIVAYDYPAAEKDLNTYRAQFGLPACTSATGCFTKINQNGVQGNYPPADPGWSVEAALDMQMISAACPTCKIVLAEARSPYDRPLDAATDAAVAAGATVTNHSYGASEVTGVTDLESHYAHPGVTAVAATGDWGYQPASFPASSPEVVAVGGTVLRRSTDARGWSESVWRFGGSGCSGYFAKPAWQDDAACGMRTSADLSAVSADLAVYVTSVPRPYRGWLLVGGTSASSPLVAGMIGAAGAGGLEPGDLYGDPGAFHDVTTGRNGYCKGSYLCTGAVGFDAPTGWGTPAGLAPFLSPALP